MEDYYFDEIGAVIGAWNQLHDPNHLEEEEVDAVSFFGGGGERVG